MLSGPRARRVLAEEIEDYRTYGLDPPTTVLELGLKGGRTWELYLGKTTPDGSGYYAYQEGDDRPLCHRVDLGSGAPATVL